MRCPQCQRENPENKKFCGKCGRKLALTCPQCGSETLPEDTFCGECGHDLRKPKESPRIDYTHQVSRIHWMATPSPENLRKGWLWNNSRVSQKEEVPINAR